MKENIILLTLISILADGKFHSYSQLKVLLGISYIAVNDHIQILRSWNIDVLIFPDKKGCMLTRPIQLLNKALIQNQIGRRSVTILSATDSTNQYLLDRLDILRSGDACIAEYQHHGRGRRNRKWFSPFGSNLYFSIYWNLKNGAAAAIGLSLAIAIVIAEVLHDIGADQVRVKWPNDIYLLGRKLAGVLVELTEKTRDVVQIVIGVGINLTMQSIQAKEIDQNWINLQEAGIDIDRNTLIIRLIKELRASLNLFEQNGFAPFYPRWGKLSSFINHKVKLIIGEREIYGISRGIDSRGAIMLDQNGIIKPWLGEEISLIDMNKESY